MHPPPRPAAVAESKVMGKAAVAWVIAVVQPVSIAQLAGWSDASASVQRVGAVGVPTLWSATAVLSGVVMALSIITRDPEAKRVWEIAANLFLALTAAVFVIAALEANGWSLDGVGWAVSISIGLTGSCLGRAGFLAHQIWWVYRRAGDLP